MDFKPDVVLIKLGTNDAKPQNWEGKESFMADYQNLIDNYQAFSSHLQIILLTPIRCFLVEKNTINPSLIENDICSLVEQLAFKNELGIINLFNLYGNQ